LLTSIQLFFFCRISKSTKQLPSHALPLPHAGLLSSTKTQQVSIASDLLHSLSCIWFLLSFGFPDR
jgi:hypothetical protein